MDIGRGQVGMDRAVRMVGMSRMIIQKVYLEGTGRMDWAVRMVGMIIQKIWISGGDR